MKASFPVKSRIASKKGYALIYAVIICLLLTAASISICSFAYRDSALLSIKKQSLERTLALSRLVDEFISCPETTLLREPYLSESGYYIEYLSDSSNPDVEILRIRRSGSGGTIVLEVGRDIASGTLLYYGRVGDN